MIPNLKFSSCQKKQGTERKKKMNRVKRKPMEQEKIAANHIPEKGLIFPVCKKLRQLNK